MMKWKVPPWIKWRPEMPKKRVCWMVALLLLLIFPQALTGPLLSGAVDWNSSSITSQDVEVLSKDPTALFGDWYWYLSQEVTRKEYLRKAAGIASLAWANVLYVGQSRTDQTGNGCRHVVYDYGMEANSTILGDTIPCIKIHDISWANSPVPSSVTDYVGNQSSLALSLVGDAPFNYYHSGAAVLFDPENTLWNTSDLIVNDTERFALVPSPTLFSGTKTIGLLVQRQPNTHPEDCSPIRPNPFGDTSNLTHIYAFSDTGNQNCYRVGTVNFTAGVMKTAVTTYVSNQVVEAPAGESLQLQADIWVQEALWFLPDLMTMIAVMNSSSMPTWNNMDDYVEMLIRYSYLAAWDMYHSSFDENGTSLVATRHEPRLQATVSSARVFSWLAISLLMTLSGILLFVLETQYPPSSTPEDDDGRKWTEALEGLVNLS